MTTAERNRAIKATLTKAFGQGNVRVRGNRGTAYGWVDVHINWTPLDADQAREMKGLVWQLLAAADLSKEIDTYGYDDPGSDYGYGSKCSIDFNDARYYQTMRHSDGTMSVRADRWSDWQSV